MAKMTAMAISSVLVMATLGDTTRIEMILFVLSPELAKARIVFFWHYSQNLYHDN
jgi:hypothetical protein